MSESKGIDKFKPNKGDKSHTKALIGSYFSGDFKTYSEGYYQAATTLMLQSTGKMNILVYPIFFLYRHYIELSLKAIIEQYIKLGSCELEKRDTHKLKPLFNIVNKARKKHEKSSFSTEIKEIIENFSAIDERSQTFRYPINRERKQFFTKLDVLGLNTLKTQMRILEKEFTGLIEGLDEEIRLEHENSSI